MNTTTDVVLILWNRDVIDVVSFVLLHRDLKSRGLEPSEGRERIEDLILSCSPSVVIFDLDPPYDRSAAIALDLLDRFRDCSFVMTCADSNLALKKAPWLSGYALFQKPYEIDEMANTVRSMVRQSPRRVAAFSVGA
jgi:hypothetical protein